MASIKLAYIGGGSTRAPGTISSLIDQGHLFDGSEVVLIDLNEEHLEVVKEIAERMTRARGHDISFTTTVDRRAGLQDCDVVLTSFRPGGFEARHLDESIPLKYGIIGQETQGPGGFFMALRSIHVMKDIVAEMEAVCPEAFLINYTNPINIVSEAVSHHTDIRTISLCEGPIIFPREIAEVAGLDPDLLDVDMVGLNHACWSVRQLYDGQELTPLLAEAYERKRQDPSLNPASLRMLRLAVEMDSIPASYFQYYYYRDEILAELQAKPTTRSQDIMAAVPDYWKHYREQARSDNPVLDPGRSRGGIHELELAIDVIDAIFNDRKEVWPVNVVNSGALAEFPPDRVVEMRGYVDRHGVTPLSDGHLPRPATGLVKMLGEYQALTAEAAWSGGRKEAIQALVSNPLVMSLEKAESLYDEMAHAHRQYLPERLMR